MMLFFLALVLVCAGAFAFLNGFRDASSSVALAVRTRALTPTVAVLLAGLFNFIGAGLSAALVLAVSQAWLTLPAGTNGLTILLAGLLSAILWGLYLWWRGIPASSTHALVGGLAGAGVASVAVGGNPVTGVDTSLLYQVALPLLVSPVIAYVGAYLLVWPASWAARYTPPNVVNTRSRRGPGHCRGRRRLRARAAGRPAHRRGGDPGAAGGRALRRRFSAGVGGPADGRLAVGRDPGGRLADFLHHRLPADPDRSRCADSSRRCTAR